ncbi:MAG: DUF4214 domain-containing protein [Pseudomonadota bacterium]
MREFENDAGGKLEHPGLTSNEIFDLVQLASAAYDESFFPGSSFDGYRFSQAWFPVTADLGSFGLDTDAFLIDNYYFRSETYAVDPGSDAIPGTAEAVVFSNRANDVVLAFRGTADGDDASFWDAIFESGDRGDWLNRDRHYEAFDPLFTALEGYLEASGAGRLLVAGHSLGGAMAEFFMEEYADGSIEGIEFEAVAVASPDASQTSDPRVLNIGHDGDTVYSIAGFLGGNATDNLYVVFDEADDDENGEGGDEQHDISVAYAHSVSTLLSSQFYNTTARNSEVVISYTDEVERLRDFVDDNFTPDDSQLILGRGADLATETLPNIKSGGELSIDDHLIGGDGDDWLEGFRGDDILEGDVNDGPFAGGNDTMAGGEGKDLFLGAPEDLNGDTIVDLEIGDRIGVSGATVDEETLEDEEGGDTTITFNADSGLFDIGGTDVSITATLPVGALLRLSDDTLEDGGSIIEVVEGTTLTPDQDFYTGTTSNGLILASWTRDGDLSFAIDVLNDGTVLRPSGEGFVDAVLTMPSGLENFEHGGVDLRGLTGSQEDVLIEVVYSVSPDDSPLADLVTFTQDTIRYLFIGDGVDDRGGGVWGDPHLLTFDNVGYDFQAAGEFVLAHATTGDPYTVQARFVAISSAASVTEAIGTLVDGSTVAVEVDGGDGSIVVDGVVTELADGASVTVGAGTISRDGNGIQIDHGNGDVTLVTAFTTFLSVAPQPSLARDPGSLEGLLGNGNGTPADDFQLSDGSVLTTPVPVETLYGDFADSWRVQPGDRLLPGDPEPFAAPERIITLDSIPQDLREQAEAAVDAMGITNPILRDAAILDFALTGDEQFIEASQLLDESFDPLVDTIAVDPVSNPVIVLSAGTLTIDEDDPATRVLEFTVSRGATVGDVTVNFSASGIGVSPTDADDFVGNITSGSVQIPDGSESQTFTLEIANDALDEGTENFSVSIEVEPAQAAEYEVLVSSVNISVLDDDEPVNTAPTAIELSPASVDENAAAATVVGAVTVTDPDAGDTHTLTLVDDAGGRFALDGSDIVVAAGAMLDFEASALHTVTVRATDAGGLSVEQDVEIAVNDLNEAPTLAVIADQPVDENRPAGTVIATAAASDPDGDTLTYSLGGEDAGLFAIDAASGEIRLAFSPDFEAPADADGDNRYALSVAATDPGGATDTQSLAVEVQDVNEAPTLAAITDKPVDENRPAGTVIATAAASDPDGDTLTYSLGGADAGLFAIDAASGEISLAFSPDFEAPADADGDNRYALSVAAADPGGATDTQSFAVEVLDISVIDEFAAMLNEAGWLWPDELGDSLKSTEPLLNYPDLDSVLDSVIRLYTGMLGRAPDKDGAEYWITQLNAGNSLRDLANGFVGSDEFTDLINQMGGGVEGSIEALYQNVLGRDSDAEGRAYWLDEWNSGRVDIAEMAISFTNSAEYINASYPLVQGAKMLLWGVNLEELSPDALGFDMQAFVDEQHVAESLVRLYTGVLDREPDREGFDYWLAQMSKPSELDTLANVFINSAEFLDRELPTTPEAFIDELYRNVLDREADEDGHAHWLEALDSGELDSGDLVLAFTNSEEYRQESQPLVDDYLLKHYDGGLVGIPVDTESYLLG